MYLPTMSSNILRTIAPTLVVRKTEIYDTLVTI
jgi:hypothetical protein